MAKKRRTAINIRERETARGTVYSYDFMVGRVRYRGLIPAACQTGSERRDYVSSKRKEIREGKNNEPAPTVGSGSMVQFAEGIFLPWSKARKKSWRTDGYHVAALKRFFGDSAFEEVDVELVERFIDRHASAITKRKAQRAPASVNRMVACLSKIFTLAIKYGAASKNPCKLVERLVENNRRSRVLLPDEEVALLEACVGPREYLKPIIMVAIQSGMRRGELLGLRWRDVDFLRGTIYLAQTKTGSPQTVAMNRVVRSELVALQEKAPASEYVFTNPGTGKPYVHIGKGFNAACREAKIEGLHFHDLRATCATRLMHRGADPATIQSVLRHSDSKITLERYTRAIDERKRQALEKIADYAESELDCQKIVKIEERRHG